jgi:hypothetical protein
MTVLAVEDMRQAYQKSASYLAIPKRKKGGAVASTRVGNYSMTLIFRTNAEAPSADA